ncbi:aminopeptidase N [Schaalia suimastitidis]|uniref:aminopeptidase N n=1 Tax=Schaalia suimastitidis TaxID=121163 RepID=UPI00047E13AB|nr:aminopeptidase N [Schaalia suimastitidis]
MKPLSRIEAQERRRHIELVAMDVAVDLRGGADKQHSHYPVTSTLTLVTSAPTVVIDCDGVVENVTINDQVWQWHHADERLTLSHLPLDCTLTITVSAQCAYSRSGEGLHRYFDPEDHRVYLYTQFEPADAHRAWPCFDQPDFKCPWTFHVSAPADWVVTSNGICQDTQRLDQDSLCHHFAPTPPLSSYITAVVAGNYAIVDGGVWNGCGSDGVQVSVPLRLMCRQALAPHMDSDDIFTVTRQGLDFFHRHYGTTYPWGSYDQVFVPEYNLGAMENPGCVTFTETYLSRDTLTYIQRQRRANTILHEMCHMWFGDLVTPAWWDDLWLKESFADHQGTYSAAAVTQYTGEWASFAISRKAWAYQQDLLPTTHPIIADIPDVAAAKNAFDGITYAKGASVLKQLVAWVGHEAFFAGARQYFQRYAYSATTMDDLLNCLEEASGHDLTEWTTLWLRSTSPSLLRADIDVQPDGAVSSFVLRQEATPGTALTVRPHYLVVSTWALRDGVLQRTHRIDTRLDGTSVDLDPQGIFATAGAAEDAALIVVNDEDLTYAITRLDQASMRVALSHISTCPSAITRAVVWSSLFNSVRDGELAPQEYIRAVMRHCPTEDDEAIASRLLDTAALALRRYIPRRDQNDLAAQCLDTAAELCTRLSAARSDVWREWLHFYIKAAQCLTASVFSEDHNIVDLSSGHWRGVEVPQAVAWGARAARAAYGLVGSDALTKWLDSDFSAENKRFYRTALCALPSESRSEHWRTALGHTLSNDDLSASLRGYFSSTASGRQDVIAFFDAVTTYWDTHSIGMGIRFVNGAFPTDPELYAPEEVQAWLDAHQELAAPLQRLLVEHHDELQRTARIRQVS